MTQLIKIKKPYVYYAQLAATGAAALLCFYILSVSAAGEERLVKIVLTKPSNLSVVSSEHEKGLSQNKEISGSDRNKPSNKVTATNEKSLQLGVDLPKRLLVSDSEIKWQIRQNGETIHDLEGNHQSVRLPDGLYNVLLQIGKYQQKKQITVKAGQQVQPYFQIKLGRVQISADHPVDWEITGPEKTVYKVKDKQAVNAVLPAGMYQVKAVLPALTQRQTIEVKSGQYFTKHLNVPLGKVNLIAVRDNQPLLQSMKWEVFRLEKKGRHKVGEYYLHSKSINIPPGRYEAVAHHQKQISKRRFLVQEATTNKVVLVME